MDVVGFIQQLTLKIITVAWAVFLLAWSTGWLLKGTPIPFPKIKRTGQDFIEDAVWAAFWLAMGGTVFALIAYLTSNMSMPMPQPPSP